MEIVENHNVVGMFPNSVFSHEIALKENCKCSNTFVGKQVTIRKFRSLSTKSHTTLKSVCFNNECETEITVWNVEWFYVIEWYHVQIPMWVWVARIGTQDVRAQPGHGERSKHFTNLSFVNLRLGCNDTTFSSTNTSWWGVIVAVYPRRITKCQIASGFSGSVFATSNVQQRKHLFADSESGFCECRARWP